MLGSEKETIFIDNGQEAAPVHGGFSWTGKLSGTVSGTKATGTFHFNEVDTIVPSM
jgi:hypothetical protein